LKLLDSRGVSDLDISNFFVVVRPIISRSTREMTTLKERKSIKKPLSEEAKKERSAKARATRHRHKMETLYSEYQVDLSMEKRQCGSRNRRKRKNKPYFSGTALERKIKKGNKAAVPPVAMAKGGGSDNEEEDTDDVATVDDIDEGGDKKPTAKTVTADSKPGNNNEDGTNKNGYGDNKNDNEDDNGNEENE
jgi:hypothetical protein